MSFGDITRTVDFGSCTGGSCGSSNDWCYEQLQIHYTATSILTYDLPVGVNWVFPEDGTSAHPPPATLDKKIVFEGWTQRTRYCEEKGLEEEKRGEAQLSSSKIQRMKDPNSDHERVRITIVLTINLAMFNCDCDKACLPQPEDGCSELGERIPFRKEETKYDDHPLFTADSEWIWAVPVNTQGGEGKEGPAEICLRGQSAVETPQQPFMRGELDDALGLLCQSPGDGGVLSDDNCCDPCKFWNIDESSELLDGMSARYEAENDPEDPCYSMFGPTNG